MLPEDKYKSVREEWMKADATGDVYDANSIKNYIADWWIEKFSSHDQKIIEDIQEKLNEKLVILKDSDYNQGYEDALDDALSLIKNNKL